MIKGGVRKRKKMWKRKAGKIKEKNWEQEYYEG